MTWIIPFTFIAGTKAKANEVNGNFTSLKQFVDSLETQGAENEVAIQQLEQTKADLNGNPDQRFQVDDAVNTKDAVNKETLSNLIDNTKELIKGFKLSKFNDNTISSTAGSCYDSTYEYMIISTISLSKSQENLGQNATYYVYVCMDKETKANQLIFSLSATTPELPADYDYFRRLGKFTTDSTGKIDTVTSDSGASLDGVVTFPNWSLAAGRSPGVAYTADQNGWVFIYMGVSGDSYPVFTVNGVVVGGCGTWKYDSTNCVSAPVSKGDTYLLTGASYNRLNYNFVPCKTGGN